MTAYDKKRRVAMIAVAHYLEQEKLAAIESNNTADDCCWSRTGKEFAMNTRQVIQRRGRLLRSA